MKRILQTLLFSLVFVCATSSYGQMMYEATGGHALIDEIISTVDLPDGNTLVRSVSEGFLWANEEDVVGGNGAMTCYTSGTVSPDGERLDASGTCDVVDLDGDLWRIWWVGPMGGNWGMTGGTGKYQGISGSGTWKLQAIYPDGKTMNEWAGSWTIPAHEMEME